MYNSPESFKQYIKGKKVAVIGIGISNTPLISMLAKAGAAVTAHDKKSKAELGKTAEELEQMGVKLCLGEGYLNNIMADIVFKTPGMRYDNPALLKAKENGAYITSEMEVFFDICPSKIIAVTGSDGKTTTTTLIYEFLKREGIACHLGGNIGKPVLYRVDEMKKEDYVVLELSSFQLHTMKKSPHIAVITNITPNHLDVHKSYDEYIDAKKNIMRYQGAEDIVVLNAKNEKTAELIPEAKGKCITFSAKEEADICLKEGAVCFKGERLLNIDRIKIPGMHNVENYMAAIGATLGIVKKETILKTAEEFGGVPHRIELVRVLNGVKYYNSSIDSSPNRTINTLKVFEEKVILIAGGKDKGIPYDDIGGAVADKVKLLILVGATAEVIKKAAEAEFEKRKQPLLPIYILESFGEAVKLAHENAEKGDVVIMSNASTSFDKFKNFEERGNLFKKLVNDL